MSFALNELSIVNFGILKGSGGTAVFCQAGAEQVYNHGTIVGSVNLGDGIDLYDASFGGTVQGLIDLGTGDDTGIGGDQRDVFIAGTGNDDIDGGGGDDTFRAGVASGTDGNDIFDGGTGRDTFNATDSANAVFVNLAEGYARGARIGNDTLIDIERAIGSVGGDTLTGDDLNNVLVGLNGNDTLIGGVGIDRIDGGNNNDFLTGGAGRDILTGGAGIDNFIFTAATDSGITNATRDRITDFLAGTDDIDVSALAGTFTFIGTGPFTAAGNQIRFQAEGTDTLVEISTDTDTDAEMSILLVGTIVLTAGDFDI